MRSGDVVVERVCPSPAFRFRKKYPPPPHCSRKMIWEPPDSRSNIVQMKRCNCLRKKCLERTFIDAAEVVGCGTSSCGNVEWNLFFFLQWALPLFRQVFFISFSDIKNSFQYCLFLFQVHTDPKKDRNRKVQAHKMRMNISNIHVG